MPRRHPILLSLFALLLAGAAALALFVATFDLDLYRNQLQESLSAALSRPVTLGQAHLSISHGPAFDFTEIQVGAAGDPEGSLSARRLLVKLEPRALLGGRIVFSEIHIEAPTISLQIDPPPAASQGSSADPAGLFLQQLQRIQVSDLSIDGGTLNLTDNRTPGAPYRHVVSGIKARIQGLAQQEMHVSAEANLKQQTQDSPLQLRGRLTQTGVPNDWRKSRLDLDLTMGRLLPSPLLRHYAPDRFKLDTSGRLNLALTIEGAIATGLRVSANARGEKFSVSSPTLYTRPFPVQTLRLAGTWRKIDGITSIDPVQVHLDDKQVSGKLTVEDRQGTPWIETTMTSNPVDLRDLLQSVPDAASPAIAEILKASPAGTIRLEDLSFSGPAQSFRRPADALALAQGCISLKNGNWENARSADLTDIQGRFCLNQNRLEIKAGSLQVFGSPVSVSGQIAAPFNNDARASLKLEGHLPSGRALARLLPTPPESLSLTGPVPASLSLDGPLRHLQVALEADLEGVTAHFADHFHKPAGEKGRLSLAAGLTPQRLTISRARVSAGPVELHATGNVSFDDRHDFSAEVQLIDLDLAAGRAMFPLLERLEARGQVSLTHRLRGSGPNALEHQGELSLNRVGVHLTRVIADINDASGTVRLSGEGLEAPGLSLKLGQSPLRVDAFMAGFKKPQLDLRIKAPSIRADELIFRSDQAYLRDVDGHLVINAKGIFFDPVQVRLDGGTDARVTGSVTNFKAPHTALEIEAGFGNIDEVIALWNRPDGKPGVKTPGVKKNKATLIIAAKAHTGRLWNLRFTDAEGEISLRDGVLTILPLKFNSGTGFCQGQVAVDATRGGPALLKISGHLERFDAYSIYNELLKRKGLVSGTLAGDFYLEGTAGSSFLETSRGAFSFSVSDGVLRKFPFLSKVFSVLNVSQLLTLKLPDMDSHGMPFGHLKANATLHEGTLSTRDLLIDSNAMNLSLVGELSLKEETVDMTLGVKPLGTVDQIITHIPIAGWILAGEEKALITAHFQIEGKTDSPTVTPIPITSISEKVLGIFRRVLELPAKVISDTGEALKR